MPTEADPAVRGLPPLTYLSFDSLVTGVGASQVLPYVERLARRGLIVDVHSFEHEADAPATSQRLSATGARWHPHRFGPAGELGGVARVARGAVALRGAELVHARSDMAAGSALLARRRRWVWDVRSFWVDQRIALGMVQPGSRVERTMRAIERQAAASCTGIITLTRAAIDQLARRHGGAVADKARVITTCVDLDHFTQSPFPDGETRLLLSGSFNALYDLPTMLRFVERLRMVRPVAFTMLRPEPSPWDDAVRAAGGTVSASAFPEVPGWVRSHHAGLSVCHTDHPAAINGAMPTKIGEFLACGRPVVVNRGLGDLDALLPPDGAGVVLSGVDDDALDRAAHELLELLDDPDTPERCRAIARRHFDLEAGVNDVLETYAATR